MKCETFNEVALAAADAAAGAFLALVKEVAAHIAAAELPMRWRTSLVQPRHVTAAVKLLFGDTAPRCMDSQDSKAHWEDFTGSNLCRMKTVAKIAWNSESDGLLTYGEVGGVVRENDDLGIFMQRSFMEDSTSFKQEERMILYIQNYTDANLVWMDETHVVLMRSRDISEIVVITVDNSHETAQAPAA